MKKYIDQVKQLKQQPEHVRHRVALGSSVAVTALVGVVWLVGSAVGGKFVIAGPNIDTGEEPNQFANSKTQFSDLVGAAAQSLGASSTQPQLSVVDGGTTSTIDSKASAPTPPTDATAIPF